MCRNRKAFLCVVLATMFYVGPIRGQSEQTKSFLSDVEILARWEKTYMRIRSLRVAYRMLLIEYRPPQADADEPGQEHGSPVKHSQVERIEQGKRFHLRYSLAPDGLSNSEWLVEFAYDGKITYSYMGSTKRGVVSLVQRGGSEETKNMPKRFMFLMNHRTPDVLKDEYPEGIPELALWFRLGKLRAKVIVRPILEYAAGEPCHVVEVIDDSDYGRGPRELKQVFWLAHDKGMCVMKYQFVRNGEVSNEIEIEEIGEANLDGGSLWYPQKAYRTTHHDRFGTIKNELTVTEFVPNVKVDDSTFRLDYATGTPVSIRPAMTSHRWSHGMKFVADELSNSIRYVPDDWSIVVRAGRPLPMFEGIEIGRPGDQVKDRPVLLCFFDVEQRPSRNCLEQLWAKRRELEEKDVLIVPINASKIDRAKLNEWVKEHNIQLEFGTITADIEKTRFTWGVRALPWLILTDNKHVVTAEGFRMTELEERLGRNCPH